MIPYSLTQFDSALSPGINTACAAATRLIFVAKRLTKLGQRIIGLKATTLAPVNQKICVQLVGLTC
jgi:hypothetical protein